MSAQLDTDKRWLLMNPEPQFPCVILADTSGSTCGEPIAQINAGLMDLAAELRKDDLAALRAEIAVMTFGPDVRVARGFTPAAAFEPPRLAAAGGTPMAEAILGAMDAVTERLRLFEQMDLDWFKPWIVMLSDGKATSPRELMRAAAARIREAERRNQIGFFAVGTDDADMQTLASLSLRPPLKMRRSDYAPVFRWLSTSICRVSQSMVGGQLRLPAPEQFNLSPVKPFPCE